MLFVTISVLLSLKLSERKFILLDMSSVVIFSHKDTGFGIFEA